MSLQFIKGLNEDPPNHKYIARNISHDDGTKLDVRS